jgi:hypothetical protein
MSEWRYSLFRIGGTVTKRKFKALMDCFKRNSTDECGFDECAKRSIEEKDCLELEASCDETVTMMEELCVKYKLSFWRAWDHDSHGSFKHTWAPGMKEIRIACVNTEHDEYITTDQLKHLIEIAFTTKRQAPLKMGDTDLLMQARVKELLEGTGPDPKEYLLRYINGTYPDDPEIPPFIVKG